MMIRRAIKRGVLPLVLSVTGAAAGCHNGRYVREIRGPLAVTASPAPEANPDEEALLREIAAAAEKGGLLGGIHERLHLTVKGQVAYTVVVEQGRAAINRGIAAGVTPTMTVPVTLDTLRNLRQAIADGRLEPGELFNMAYVLFLPCLRRIHGMYYFVEPGDKSALMVDNHMQFRLKNTQGFTYHGQAVDPAWTVLNVDGVFFYLPGLVGDPDVRYELDVAEALDLYRTLVYQAEAQRGNLLGLRALGQHTQEVLTRSITYQRAWH